MDTGAHPSFQYQSLTEGTKQIRLLIVRPGEFTDPLECDIVHEDIGQESFKAYETISYCWGTETQRNTTTINGSTVSVPVSSARAIRRVRLVDRPRTIWIDAVCINQDNIRERGQQVAFMDDIYSNGTCNLIYLGEEDVLDGLKGCRSILEEVESSPRGYEMLRGSGTVSTSALWAEYNADAVAKLFSLPWFSRLWIVQEAALAKRNMCFCGTLVFDLVEVTRAALWLRLHLRTSALPKLYESTRLPAVLNAYVDHAHGWYHGPPEHVPPEQIEHTYNTLATISRVNEATNPIDKLYGVLGLINHATGTKGIDIFPDYEKPIAWAFRAAAWSSIMSTSKLSILLLVYNRETDLENARPTQDADDEFPSWTPRLQRAWDPQCDPVPVLTDYQASSSITSSARSLNPREAGPYLTVDGICVGKVRARSGPILEPPSDGGYDIEDTLRQIFGMVDQFVSLARKERPPTTGGLALRELACAVVSGLDHNREQATDEWIEHAYSSLRSLLLRPGVNIPGLNDVTAETGPEAVLASQFFLAMGSTCLNRCLFALDPPSELQGTMGSIASGPTFTREGDIVAILYGYDWPAILRPVDDGSWQFVGPCYVYGIMRGEAVPVLRGSDYERIFVLC